MNKPRFTARPQTRISPLASIITISLVTSSLSFAAEFNNTSGELNFSSIDVDNEKYQATLVHKGNLIFHLKDATKSSSPSDDAFFNTPHGRITAKDVLINNKAVDIELYQLSNGTFMANTLTSFEGKTFNYNREANIPPMCYTDTQSRYNPCYTCHQNVIDGVGHENRMDDGHLQGDYTFSDIATTNRWRNLFIDRSEAVNAISDEEILAYINQDNYSDLAERLKASNFSGWIPDLKNLHSPEQAFASNGFAKDGSGWVAFNYKPLPSTFWPTNGSTDDVMIRMAKKFRSDSQGNESKTIYQANLAILEAAIKNMDEISVAAIDENQIGTDLNGDGQKSTIRKIKRPSHYVGAASDTSVNSFLYPKGTEFLHTVRYVGVTDTGEIYNSPRMKEVRYMVKEREYKKPTIGGFYAEEQFEKEQEMYPYYNNAGDAGLTNSFGWKLQGFIEAQDGSLRPQNYEETFFCMGCHTTIGSTIDKVFSFGRKVDGEQGWTYINLKGMKDVPAKGELVGEIKNYLKLVGGGDEFRQNDEMVKRWFTADGQLNEAAVDNASDVYELITPSRERALSLNKAYRVIVKEQSYIRGRDASVKPATNVLQTIDKEIPPLPANLSVKRDIRLDW